jgi:1-deoxy-D-xylulose-5-phosphate synthase
MGASDEAELIRMINTAVNINDRPSAFRYPRGNGLGVELPGINEILEIGKGKIVKDGNKVAILCFGGRLQECLKAAEKLDSKGIFTTVADARFAKPLDEKLIMNLCLNHEVLITIEEGSIGGFGSHVFQMLSERGFFDKGFKIRSMVLPDQFIDQDTPENMYKTAGLDAEAIEQKILNALKSNIVIPSAKQFN